MNFADMLDEKSRWGKLRLLGNSPIARSTIAIPLLGYFLIFNTTVVDFLRLHTSVCGEVNCSATWRLHFLYFGCCFTALGASIYSVYCPSVVKIYSGASEFFEAEKAYFSGPSNLRYLFDLIEKESGKPADDPFQLRIHIITAHAAVNRDHTQALADIMGQYYVLQNTSGRTKRIFALLSYQIGIALILVPTITTFAQILGNVFKTVHW